MSNVYKPVYEEYDISNFDRKQLETYIEKFKRNEKVRLVRFQVIEKRIFNTAFRDFLISKGINPIYFINVLELETNDFQKHFSNYSLNRGLEKHISKFPSLEFENEYDILVEPKGWQEFYKKRLDSDVEFKNHMRYRKLKYSWRHKVYGNKIRWY